MIVAERTDALDRLATIAALAGINMNLNQRAMRLEGCFTFKSGRSQVCYARPSGMVGDKFVVTLFSPCARIKKSFLGGVTKEMAVDLLRRNENILFARFGMIEDDNGFLIVASADYILDSLDPEEFEHAIWHVAMAADGCEMALGKGVDEF